MYNTAQEFTRLLEKKRALDALSGKAAYYNVEPELRKLFNEFIINADLNLLNAYQFRVLCKIESSHRFMPLHSFLLKISGDNF